MAKTGKIQVFPNGKRLILPSGKCGVLPNEDDCCPCVGPTCDGSISWDYETCILTWETSGEDIEEVEVREHDGLDETVKYTDSSGTVFTPPFAGVLKLWVKCNGTWQEKGSVTVSDLCEESCCDVISGKTYTWSVTLSGPYGVSGSGADTIESIGGDLCQPSNHTDLPGKSALDESIIVLEEGLTKPGSVHTDWQIVLANRGVGMSFYHGPFSGYTMIMSVSAAISVQYRRWITGTPGYWAYESSLTGTLGETKTGVLCDLSGTVTASDLEYSAYQASLYPALLAALNTGWSASGSFAISP